MPPLHRSCQEMLQSPRYPLRCEIASHPGLPTSAPSPGLCLLACARAVAGGGDEFRLHSASQYSWYRALYPAVQAFCLCSVLVRIVPG